jgi:hypothetical protein
VALAEINREISTQIGGLRGAGAEAAEAAMARGAAVVDFDVAVSEGAVDAFDRLGSLIRRMGESLGRRHLLSMPPSEQIIAYRRWFRDEILSQLGGVAPRPCPFTPASA